MRWHLQGPGSLALMISYERTDVEAIIERVAGDFNVVNFASEKAAKNLFICKIINASQFHTALMQDVAYMITAPEMHAFSWRVAKLS